MKRTVLLCVLCFIVIVKAKPQVILNEIYTDPGAGKHEFFELYNTSGSVVPMSLDDYTIVTFFEISGVKGFYVMDLPNLTINPQGFFVGSAAIPFNYQGITNSTASDFCWNNASLTGNNGYLKKWVLSGSDILDGNLDYDEAPLPPNFNDFFFRRTGAGHSYCVFVYKNGTLVNTFIGGTGGNSTILTAIVLMPDLHIDMVNPASTDFDINWSVYNTIPLEYCTEEAGSDNGYIRELDGGCGMWDKSSAGIQHTPQQTNGGKVNETTGTISVSSVIVKGNAVTGSYVEYEVVAVATPTSFPVELMIYVDNGTTNGVLDPGDIYVESNMAYSIGDGPFTTYFFPYTEDALVVVKSSAGCLDKIQYLPNVGVLAVNLATFNGNMYAQTVQLEWNVLFNEAADRYIVERSVDGRNFNPIGVISASNKLGSETYGWNDNAPEADRLHYRLKIYNKHQDFEYSRILVFQAANNDIGALRIIGNPVTDKLTVSYTSDVRQSADLHIYDLSGRKMMSQKMNAYEGTNLMSIQLPASLKSGMYVAEVTSGSNRYMGKFIKQ